MKDRGTETILTERLILRRFEAGDANHAYANWCSDPQVVKFLTWPVHASVKVTEEVIQSWISQYCDPCFYQWAICLKETDEVIGSISVVNRDESAEAAEIGYCIGRAYWRQGITAEALKAVVAYLRDAGYARICARHDTNNPASGRVMAKAGMQKEGILRHVGRNNTGICDLVIYAVIFEDR